MSIVSNAIIQHISNGEPMKRLSVPSRITLVVFEQFEQRVRHLAMPGSRKLTPVSHTRQMNSLDGPRIVPNDRLSSSEKSPCEHKRCPTTCRLIHSSCTDCIGLQPNGSHEVDQETSDPVVPSLPVPVAGRTWPIVDIPSHDHVSCGHV